MPTSPVHNLPFKSTTTASRGFRNSVPVRNHSDTSKVSTSATTAREVTMP